MSLFVLLVFFACGGGEQSVKQPVPAPEPKPPATVVPDLSWRLADQGQGSPATRSADPSLVATRAILAKVVQDHARDPDNPWAVSHGILALGPEIELTNGHNAVDWLFETYAKSEPVGSAPGIRFPRKAGTIRIEPHTDLILKALTESGVDPGREVKVGGRPFQVGDLYRHSLSRIWVSGERVSVEKWNDTPWALQALAAWGPKDLAWTAQGHPMNLDIFTEGVVSKLSSETAFMREAMEAGETVQKRGQGIFAYTCGGAHLLQGAAYAVWRGFGGEAPRLAIVDEVAVLYWRLDVELGAVDQALQQHPEYAVVLLEQRMKFLGHFLESAHKLAAMGFYVPNDAHLAELDRATKELVKTVGVLEAMGIFGRLDELKTSNEQTYLDFVGDSAHALRGIDLSTGKATIR